MKRIAWFSPLTQSFTLHSARFSLNVLPKLERNFEIEVFVDDIEWRALFGPTKAANALSFAGAIHHFHRFAERDRSVPFDFCVYHFEDHQACDYVARTQETLPGLSFFHDLNLNRMHQSRFAHTTGAGDLNEWMESVFNIEYPFIGDYHMRRWPYEVFDVRYAAGSSERKKAAGIVVFSEAHARAVKNENVRASLNVSTAPLVLPLGGISSIKSNLRAVLGIEEDAFLVGYLGSLPVWDGKGIASEAFVQFRDTVAPNARLLRLTSNSDREEEPRGAFNASNPFTELAASSYSEFMTYIGLCDCVLSLRSDEGRSMAFGTHESLALGIPVICSATGSAQQLPAGAALHTQPGPGQAQEVAMAIEVLFNSIPVRETLSRNGREYVSLECDPEGVAQDVAQILQIHSQSLGVALQGARLRDKQSRRRLFEEMRKEYREGSVDFASPQPGAVQGELEHIAVELGWLE